MDWPEPLKPELSKTTVAPAFQLQNRAPITSPAIRVSNGNFVEYPVVFFVLNPYQRRPSWSIQRRDMFSHLWDSLRSKKKAHRSDAPVKRRKPGFLLADALAGPQMPDALQAEWEQGQSPGKIRGGLGDWLDIRSDFNEKVTVRDIVRLPVFGHDCPSGRPERLFVVVRSEAQFNH